MTAPLAHRIEGDGPPVVLLNGGLMSLAAWEPVAQRLGERYRVLRCDFRGQLLSPGAPPPALAGHAADVAALLDHLGWRSAHVVGTSFGAEVAIELAAAAPERVRSLLLVTAMDRVTPEFQHQARQTHELLEEVSAGGDPGRYFDFVVESAYSTAYREREAATLAERRSRFGQLPRAWFESLRGLLAAVETFDFGDRLARISAPTRVVLAGDDRMMDPARSRALAEALNAELTVHPTSGHALVAEDPAWLAAVCLDFLDRQPGSPKPSISTGLSAPGSSPSSPALRSGFVAHPGQPRQRIWWELHGRGDREVVCLLNGLAMHTRAWYPFLADLEEYDVLLYDYLGQGASASPDEPVTICELAGELAAILDENGIERAHVLGVSYGGFVALDFARLFQERLLTLTLSGILLSRERTFELYQAMSLRFYAGGRELFPLYTHYLYERIFGEQFLKTTPPETLESMRQRFEARYVDRIHSLVRLTEAQNPFFEGLDDRLEAYRAVRTPTLVLAGEQDRCIPLWAQEKLAAIFPNSRFELVPEAGHVVYLERRDLFFPRFRRFLAARDPNA